MSINNKDFEEISFGEWLRQRRRMLDFTQQSLADQVGCARITLRRIESGGRRPSKELAQILLSKLGVPEKEHLQWIPFARGLSGFPAKPSNSFTSKPSTNLPAPLTTFIGRETEQAEITKLIAKNRLVTLTGVGGIGKTSLSLQIGQKLLHDYPNGVWMVMLESLTDPALVAQSVASVFDIRGMSESPILERLIFALRTKSALLILDNCEHLLESCAQLITLLLLNCPNLKILTSSRESLGVSGEALYHVPSLALPDEQQLLEKFREYESVRLFEERAQLVQMNFALTIDIASSIAQICRCLDGIPLAIELAAAHINILSAEQIAVRLNENFNVLTSGGLVTLPRHQTLRASMDWSWDLLSESQRVLLQRLSVFAGGWILEAAEGICSEDGVASDLILNLLSQLVNKSLVVVEYGGEKSRYRLHETIRQYAREKLLETGDSETIQDRHLAYFAKLAEQAESELYRSNQVFWLNKLDDELNNLRRALDWALVNDLKLGLQLMINLAVFWEVRGNIQEVQQWLAQFLAQYTEVDSVRARALVIYGNSLATGANHSQAQTIATQSLELSRAISDKSAEAFSLWGLGAIISLSGNMREGLPIVQQSLALYRSLGDKLGQANAMGWLGLDTSDWKHSKSFLLDSLKLHRELGNLSGIAFCLDHLVLNSILAGDFSSPVQWLEEAMVINRQLGRRRGEVDILQFYGLLFYWQGDYQKACSYFEESITLGKKIGISELNWIHAHMGHAKLRQGNFTEAKELLEFCVRRFQNGNNTIGLVYAIEGLASLHLNQRQAEEAKKLIAWADSIREKIGDHRPPVEQSLVEKEFAAIKSQFDDLKIAKLIKEGKAMTTEQAITYALEFSESS